jgi:hypothetical protein
LTDINIVALRREQSFSLALRTDDIAPTTASKMSSTSNGTIFQFGGGEIPNDITGETKRESGQALFQEFIVTSDGGGSPPPVSSYNFIPPLSYTEKEMKEALDQGNKTTNIDKTVAHELTMHSGNVDNGFKTFLSYKHAQRLVDPVTGTLHVAVTILRKRPTIDISSENKNRIILFSEGNVPARAMTGKSSIATSMKEFQMNFNVFTSNALVEMDWNNVLCAGKLVCCCCFLLGFLCLFAKLFKQFFPHPLAHHRWLLHCMFASC